MSEELRSTLLHLVAPVAALGVVLVICRIRKWPVRETLALRSLPARQAVVWTTGFVVYLVATELVFTALGLSEGLAWGDRFTPLEKALRVFGMVLLAPLVEEVVFRGLLFKRLSEARPGPVGAVIITAVAFAAVHVQYDPLLLVFILADGLLLGLARWRSGSLYLPLLFHSMGNLYAAVERLTGWALLS